MTRLAIDHSVTSENRPEANDHMERASQTLKKYLRLYIQ